MITEVRTRSVGQGVLVAAGLLLSSCVTLALVAAVAYAAYTLIT